MPPGDVILTGPALTVFALLLSNVVAALVWVSRSLLLAKDAHLAMLVGDRDAWRQRAESADLRLDRIAEALERISPAVQRALR